MPLRYLPTLCCAHSARDGPCLSSARLEALPGSGHRPVRLEPRVIAICLLSVLGTEGTGLGHSHTVKHSVTPEPVFLPSLRAPEGGVVTLVFGGRSMTAPDGSCCLLSCVCSLLPRKLCWGRGSRLPERRPRSETVARIQMCAAGGGGQLEPCWGERRSQSRGAGGAGQPALALAASGAPVSRPALGWGGGDFVEHIS